MPPEPLNPRTPEPAEGAVAEVVVIGGGPAGSMVARLLASWGHRVVVVARELDRRRGLAESLPPSSRKVLAAVGALAAVEGAGFSRGIGNAVWWGEREAQLEPYDAGRDRGFQVFRPDLDLLFQQLAIAAGVQWVGDAGVTRVQPAGATATVEYTQDGVARRVRGRFIVDASGRSGVIGKPFRQYEPAFRMQALIGVWQRAGGWGLPDESYTIVETCEDGWAWSIPVAADTRHLVVMVDGTVSEVPRGRTLESTYRAALTKSRQLEALRAGAALQQTWACDASVYSSSTYAGSTYPGPLAGLHAGPDAGEVDPTSRGGFVLVGDAGATIDPLSSFGVKKALASAWMAAIAVHTALIDASRAAAALEFFGDRERQMFAAHLRQSRDYAREAYARHPHPFWGMRAAVDVPAAPGEVDEDATVRAADVQQAFAALRDSAMVAPAALAPQHLAPASLATMPLVRGNEIVLAPALAVPGLGRPIRYFAGVDLVRALDLARAGLDVPGLFDAYTRAVSPVGLPAFLQSVSLLVARGLLTARPVGA